MIRLIETVRLLRAVLREIFDEAEYGRFLYRNGLTSSPEAYAAFWREKEITQARRTRCC